MELATPRAQTGEVRTEEIGPLNMKICDCTFVVSVVISLILLLSRQVAAESNYQAMEIKVKVNRGEYLQINRTKNQ